MAKSTKKSTRKFEKNHLKDALEKRKAGAKIKQRQQVKAKRQARNAKDAEFMGGKDGEEAPKAKSSAKEDAFAKMNVDDFFQGGFEIPEKLARKLKSKSAPEKLGKRKRTEPEEEDDDDSSEASFEEAPVMSDSEDDAAEDDIGMSKGAMDALAEKDPEFYKYLKENDPEALDFDDYADLAEVDALSGSDVEEEPKKKKQKNSKKKIQVETEEGSGEEEEEEDDASEVTKPMVSKWTKAMTGQNSLRAMRQVVLAFRAAAHLNEDEGKDYKYTISNPEVYHDLLLTTLKHVPEVLNHHLPVKESASGKVRVSTDSKKFKTLSPLLKSHSTSVLHLLGSLSDAPTLKITLSSLTPLLPYLLSFKKILKTLVKSVVDIWSDPSSTEATRITAFLVVRRLAVIGDPGLREAVLKTVYQGLIKGSRSTTIHTIQGINLMKNSAAELWGIDQGVGYTTGFTFIRQLAIHLRSSITNNQKESYKTIYNWQYVHSLDFWSCVLSEHCNPIKEAESGKESELRPLIYPLVQVTLGAMRLIPTSTYFPLRFHMMRSLLRLSRATGTYIPLAAALLEVLNSAEMKKPPKPSTLKSLDFASNYKAQKTYLRTRVYQDGVGEQVVELLSAFFVLWSTSIAFPELALPVIVMLKRWLKDANNKASGNKNNKLNSALLLLIQKLEANGKFIEERRAKVDFAPNNRAGVDGFLKGFEWEKTPLGAFVVGQRKQREEKARLVEQGRREEERKRKQDRQKEKEADVSDEEMEDVDESGFESEEDDE
ncbi:Noc2-domain-containing protein [Mollisia scopiformis]|uniref:Noc2-domain-containing protein n=1 Tax=Mollisia scopiformis TaxID=149040 RepID=A0A194XVF5_MOLSC|nr:Noc2-domain-containing protein [Mollisia scopiformis]KUJ24208.1 Noc2-domain-containing protein [Mollisia scopiformis]